MSKPNYGIEMPKVVVLATGEALTEDQALAKATQAQLVEYKYNGCKWAMLVDPRKVTTEAEDNLQAVQVVVSESIGLNAQKAMALANKDMTQEETRNELVSDLDPQAFGEIIKGNRKINDANIEMLAPAVLACNDPSEDNQPTVANLKKGGLLAKLQLEALQKWWNPTEEDSQAAKKTTETQ